MTGLTLRVILIGTVFGIVFCITNLYLGLTIGAVIATTAPALFLSTFILRKVFAKSHSYLETQLITTISSMGEGLAIGAVFAIPAFFLLGQAVPFGQIILFSLLGGALGVLISNLLFYHITIQKKGDLPFAVEKGHASFLVSNKGLQINVLSLLIGMMLGIVQKLASSVLPLIKETPWTLSACPHRDEWTMNCSPSLIGAGFILGARPSMLLLAGGFLAWKVIVPLIQKFGIGASTGGFPMMGSTAGMGSSDVWADYVRYLGAGQIAIGALWYFFTALPRVLSRMRIKEVFHSFANQQNMPLRWSLLAFMLVILVLWLFPGSPLTFPMMVLIFLFGLFFILFTSISSGMIITEFNPISGMTTMILLICCFLFLALGWTERIYLFGAIALTVVLHVALAVTDKSMRNFKLGTLVGTNPRHLQLAGMIGIIIPAVVIGAAFYIFHDFYGIGSSQLPAPQGTATAILAKGIIEKSFPTTIFSIGMVAGLILGVLRVPILPVGIGIFLPISVSASLVVGGILAYIIRHKGRQPESGDQGRMMASGLVVGDACTSLITSLLVMVGLISLSQDAIFPDYASLIAYGLLGGAMVWLILRPPKWLRGK